MQNDVDMSDISSKRLLDKRDIAELFPHRCIRSTGQINSTQFRKHVMTDDLLIRLGFDPNDPESMYKYRHLQQFDREQSKILHQEFYEEINDNKSI